MMSIHRSIRLSGTRRSSQVFTLEALEQRQLLSADLLGTYVSPPTITPGQQTNIVLNIANAGDDEAKGKLEVRFYLSEDDTLGEGDIDLGISSAKGTVAAGESAELTFRSIVPASTPAGTYRLIAVLDPSNKLAENDEENNVIVSDELEVVQPNYDLSATFGDVKLPEAMINGRETKGTAKILLARGGDAPLPKGQKITMQVVLRPVDAVDDSQDVVIGTLANRNISGLNSADGTKIFNVPLRVPAEAAAGDYEMIALIDTNNDLAETNEDNNTGVDDTVYNLAEAFQDLAVESVTQTFGNAAVAGDKGKVTLNLKNLGSDVAKGDVTLRLTGLGVGGEVTLSERTLKVNLKSGQTGKTIKFNITLPNSLPDGAFQITPGITNVVGFVDTNADNDSSDDLTPVEITPVPAFMGVFGTTVTFSQTNKSVQDGPFGTSVVTTLGNFTCDGGSGTYQYTAMDLPGQTQHVLALSLEENVSALTVNTLMLKFKSNRLTELDGKTMVVDKKLGGAQGTADVRIVAGDVGLIIDETGQFRFE